MVRLSGLGLDLMSLERPLFPTLWTGAVKLKESGKSTSRLDCDNVEYSVPARNPRTPPC